MRSSFTLSLSPRIAALMLAVFALLQPVASATSGPRSDAEMIAHFKAHRAEFEALVAMYQKYGHIPSGQPEFERHAELLKRTGLSHLSEDGALWLPDPYSSDTAEKAKGMNSFHAYPHHGVMLKEDKVAASLRVRAMIWKDYFFVPVVPLVENGRLWWPRSAYGNALSTSARVFASLDDFPPEWVQGRSVAECVLRQIEPQWFLRLCASRIS